MVHTSDAMDALLNNLNDLHRSLKHLAAHLAAVAPIAPADQLKQKMETIIKQVRDKPATEIARDLIEQYSIAYEQYQQKEKPDPYFHYWAYRLLLQDFLKHYSTLYRDELMRQMGRQYGFDDFNDLANTIAEWVTILQQAPQIQDEQKDPIICAINRWLHQQQQANVALGVLEAVLAGFNINVQPIHYTGYEGKKDQPFKQLLYDNYSRTLQWLKTFNVLSNADLYLYEAFAHDLKEAIGKSPSPVPKKKPGKKKKK